VETKYFVYNAAEEMTKRVTRHHRHICSLPLTATVKHLTPFPWRSITILLQRQAESSLVRGHDQITFDFYFILLIEYLVSFLTLSLFMWLKGLLLFWLRFSQ